MPEVNPCNPLDAKPPMVKTIQPDPDKQRGALDDLDRLRRDRDELGGLLGSAGAHFGAAEAPPADRIEVWGRRIGRTLSLLAFAALAVYLYLTYVR